MKQELITFNDAYLLVWEMTESIDKLKMELQLSDIESIEFNKLVSEKRKLEYLGVRVAFKVLFGKKVVIQYDGDGKPFLTDNSFQLSVSHSKNLIAVIAHSTRPVGIDIECSTDKIQKLYKRFLSKTEQKELSDGKNINQLLLAWSAKETLFKIIGKEAVDFANQLRIFPFDVKSNGEIVAEHYPTKELYQLNYIQNSVYTLVFCLA